MNHIQNLYEIGVGGAVLTAIHALFWWAQARSERRFQYVGDRGRYSRKCMWLNLALMVVFVCAAVAAKWMGGT